MISKEHQTWMILGGSINGQDLVDDLILQLEQLDSYKNLPQDVNSYDILYKAALNILAADHAHLITILHTARMALCEQDVAKAKVIIDKAFKNRRSHEN